MDSTFPITATIDGTIHYFTEDGIKELVQCRDTADKQKLKMGEFRNTIRGFFSESEYWRNGRFNVTKSEVNDLLDSLDISRLTTKYQGTYTITGTFTVETEDESDVESIFTDNVNVEFWDGDIEMDNTEVTDIEEIE